MPDRTCSIPFARCALPALALLFGTACGPITSTAAINDARYALERADTVQAEQFARYEYTSAEAYFDKAREEWATSDFQHALSYAERALSFAEAAYERAVAATGRPTPSSGGADATR